MKKVCLNRLKSDVDKLQNFVNSMAHQEETLEQLFQCLLQLFENERKHSSEVSQLKATQVNLLNSHSSIFNIKHSSPEVAAQFWCKPLDLGRNNAAGAPPLANYPANSSMSSLNRQNNSGQNIFGRASAQGFRTKNRD